MSRGLQGVLYSVARGRARILAVEKPGVEFLDDHPDDGDASACRPEVRAEFMRGCRLDPGEEVYACWSDIEKDPDRASKFCWGQTYRQWASFMKTSVIAEVLESHALLYFAHGTADTQQSIAGFDVLRAELAAKQRVAVFERIEGADHALDLPTQKVPEGLEAVFGRVVDWFLRDVTK